MCRRLLRHIEPRRTLKGKKFYGEEHNLEPSKNVEIQENLNEEWCPMSDLNRRLGVLETPALRSADSCERQSRSCTELIADYWRQRWLLNRLRKPGVIEEVARHTCVYPIQHGAQVVLPSDEDGVFLPQEAAV